jgi:hypothetical protein
MTDIYVLEKNNIPFYIGKTVNFTVRKHYHKKKFGNDINWFFIDSIPDNEWKFWEKYYISLFKSWGFKLENKNNGGGGSTRYTKEQCYKISKIKSGMKYNMTEETKQSKSDKLTGLKRSNETKNKISLAKKGHKCYSNPNRSINISNNTPLKKKITQYNLDNVEIQTFSSANEAGRSLNKSGNSIADCAAGRQKTAFGFIWKYT